VTAETLLFRLMGKGKVQQTAMAKVAALPVEHPYRKSLLNLLVSYRMELVIEPFSEFDRSAFAKGDRSRSLQHLHLSPWPIDLHLFTLQIDKQA
jgi:hypothetical protein